MKIITPVCALLATSFAINAQVSPEWVRYPAISPDGNHIAFTYKGDIYTVNTEGGEAKRLTFHASHDYKAVWSRDSKSIAFASDRFGNFDIFKMDAKGGEAERLTFHSADEEPYTFSVNNENILFKAQRMDTASHRQYPTRRQAELYSVPANGGRINQVLTVPAEDVQISEDGKTMIYHDNKGTENQWRKHHQSAITRDIWMYEFESDEHKQLTKFEGEDRNPIFSDDGKSLYYLSEESGSFNVHRLSLRRPSSNKKISDFDTHPVRFLSMGNGTMAFSHHGHLYTMSDESKPKKVDITIRTQDIDNGIDVKSINGNISDMAVSPDGREIAFISNGEVFVSSKDGNFTKQITETAAQEAHVIFSDDGSSVMYASERDGKWSIYKSEKQREQEPFFYASSLLNESVVISNDKDNYLPKLSPDGKKLAFVEDRRSIKVLDLESNKVTTLVGADKTIHMRDGDQEFSWSPDSNWLLFQYDKLLNNSDVALLKADGSEKMKVLVPSGYYDYRPKWANDGKQLLWFSNREGLKSYATSGRSQSDVYSMFFNKEDWDKFNMTKDDFELMQAIEEAAEESEESEESKNNDKDESDKDDDSGKGDESDKDDAIELSFDWEGLDKRIARLTIHSSMLGDAVLNKDGDKLYYLSQFEDNYDLWETDLRTKDTRKVIGLNARGGRLMWDDKQETLYLLSGGSIRTLDVDDGSSESIGISGKMEINRDELYAEAFEHVWLRTSKIFYEPTFHGINWKKMRSEYKPKLPHLGNPYELTELLSEMLGELNVSHSGAGYNGTVDNADSTASLGIFYDHAHRGVGIKITEIIQGGPLDKSKLDIKAGDTIVKIDGEEVDDSFDWAKLLNQKADKFVLLEIQKADSGDNQEFTIKPISRRGLSSLLYDRYIDINQKEVERLSKGQLGYVHIPGMSDGPYRDIYNDMMGKYFDKKGIVVDTRFNGGGDLVADLAMFFTGEPFLTYATEAKVVGGEPTSRYTKPVISLFNESMYSDGHCYASGYTDLKIGKSVGMPVPGTCSFAGWEGLPTGGYWGVVPVSAKNKKGEWLENNETDPDIIVKNSPQLIAQGEDQQLERAIKELLREVD